MTDETPCCEGCGRQLDRIDHHAIDHSILLDDVYRPVGIYDGDAAGEGPGLASDVDLRCGYCHASIPRSAREYFYRRWYAVLEFGKGQPGHH